MSFRERLFPSLFLLHEDDLSRTPGVLHSPPLLPLSPLRNPPSPPPPPGRSTVESRWSGWAGSCYWLWSHRQGHLRYLEEYYGCRERILESCWSPRSCNPLLSVARGLLGRQIGLKKKTFSGQKNLLFSCFQPAGWPSQVSAQPSN